MSNCENISEEEIQAWKAERLAEIGSAEAELEAMAEPDRKVFVARLGLPQVVRRTEVVESDLL